MKNPTQFTVAYNTLTKLLNYLITTETTRTQVNADDTLTLTDNNDLRMVRLHIGNTIDFSLVAASGDYFQSDLTIEQAVEYWNNQFR